MQDYTLRRLCISFGGEWRGVGKVEDESVLAECSVNSMQKGAAQGSYSFCGLVSEGGLVEVDVLWTHGSCVLLSLLRRSAVSCQCF